MKLLKKLLLLIIVAIVIYIAWYLISPLWRTVELNEQLPVSEENIDPVDTLLPEEDGTVLWSIEPTVTTDIRDIWATPDGVEYSKDTEAKEDTKDFNASSVVEEEEEHDFSEMTFDEAQKMMEDVTMEKKEEMLDALLEIDRVSLISHGNHFVKWEAVIIESNGDRYLRYENFETINGPNLHVYLATNNNATDFIDLWPIRATKGSVNYKIPEWTDLKKYNVAMHWCVPFRVLFNTATFSIE